MKHHIHRRASHQPVAARVLLVTLFLICLLPLGSSGAHATTSAALQSNRFVVLLAGICAEDFSISPCAGSGSRINPATRTTDFSGILKQLGTDGVHIPKSNVYSYSYFIRKKLANPTWYYAADTHEPLAVAAYQLDTQLRAIVQQHPHATFDLVGHSLGGVVAAYWVVKYATPGMLSRIHSLVTLDSPVSGIKSPSAIVGSVVSGPVWLDLLPTSGPIRAIDDPISGVVAKLSRPVRQYSISTHADDGSTFTKNNLVYTISNTADQLIGPIDSELSGARANKVIFSCPPAAASVLCHVRVLHDPQAIKWAADFLATTIHQQHPATPPSAPNTPLSKIHIAFTQNNNVYLMNADGTGRRVITTNGTAPTKPNAINYPWYQWSPDGKYLLLVRENGNKYGNVGLYGHYYDLLLMNAAGHLIRTLVGGAPASEIDPTWAADADVYAYTSAIAYQPATPTVFTISGRDLSGHTLAQFKTSQFLSQCDTDPIFGARPESPKLAVPYRHGLYETFQWSRKNPVAVFNISCAAPDVVMGSGVHVKLQIGSYASGSWAGWIWDTNSYFPSLQAVAERSCSFTWYDPCLSFVNLRTGVISDTLVHGSQPTWARSGRELFFVRQTLEQTLPIPSSSYPIAIFATSVYIAPANLAQPRRLVTLQGSVGPLHPSADGRFIVFASIDNPWELQRHLQEGSPFSDATTAQYAPPSLIQLLDVTTGKITTLVRNAENPQVQP
jgi:pimeloyl-ACP methyl ester carboxylesterase